VKTSGYGFSVLLRRAKRLQQKGTEYLSLLSALNDLIELSGGTDAAEDEDHWTDDEEQQAKTMLSDAKELVD
jgi:hypothetical protein